ncbi:MAG TPA: thioesterase family protein [Sandaracinaceae bacterium LLY-WYZ-13_1]|nr:thioesterase family protein [Sandaracinaceae bacterium LLY-WYZ-13_1]
MAFTSRIRVRFGDEDHAQIVYYPRFFHFFHCAFEDFFDEQGFPYRDCLDVDRVGWPAVHAEADFDRPVRFGETLEMEVRVTRIGDKSATFAYLGRRGDGEVACRGSIVVACIDMGTYRGRPIPDKYRALFEKHLEPG